jgi:phosphatidate cytidylyltransferase
MRTKVVVGISLAAVMLVVIGLGGGWLFTFTLAGAGMALWEYYSLLRMKNIRPLVGLGIGFGLSFIIVPFIGREKSFFGSGSGSIGAIVTVYVFSILVIQFWQIVQRKTRHSILDLSVTVFGSLYIGAFLGFLIMLMNIANTQFPDKPFSNRLIVMLPMWAAWGSDAGAYFFGSFFGRNRIFPELSPKKTLEGCIGGMLTSMTGFCFASLFIHIPFFHALLLGIVASAFGQIGDLSESALKRELNIKDSGKVFAGHGGFLDRADSLLFTLPVIYYYFAWVDPWKIFK